MKVLVVDDSPAIQRSFGELLATIPGVTVVGVADDVASAVARIDALRPDLVVLDVELRGTDRGLDVLRHVVSEHPAIKVIVVSNFTWAAMRRGLLDAGALAYFDKGGEFMRARDWIAQQALAESNGPPSRE